MAAAASGQSHHALMDAVYRRQKHIYDATRKYYLFGRDGLIRNLEAEPGMSILEIGCGTGRNLVCAARSWPGIELYGLDISDQMLSVARRRLAQKCTFSRGDATGFDAVALFGRADFDRVFISYALSMIPRWEQAFEQAACVLAPGGSLHVVDFGDFGGIPGILRKLIIAWLEKFHVSPRGYMVAVAARVAKEHGLTMRILRGRGDYYSRITLRKTRPAAPAHPPLTL